MKTHRLSLLFATGLLLLGRIGFAADNLVQNASFERVTAQNQPRHFQFYFPAVPPTDRLGLIKGDPSMVQLDDQDAHEGTRSLKLSSAKPVRFSVSQNNLPPLAGQELRISVWMKGENLNRPDQRPGALVRMGFSSKQQPALDPQLQKQNVYLEAPASNFAWTQMTATVTVPTEADRTYLECFLWESSGTVWFDELTVEVLGNPNPPITSRDSDGLLRYREANAKLLAQTPAENPRILFYGDSITDQWNLESFFPGKGYINRGIGGQDTDQMLARFKQDVLGLHPNIVWFLGGTNDIAKGFTNEATLDNVQILARLCRQNSIRLIICSILPVSDYHMDRETRLERTKLRPVLRIVEINRGLRSIADQEGAVYLDLHSQMADASGQMPAEWANDGLHPNAKAYAVMSPAVETAIEREEAKLNSPKARP